MWQLFKQSSDPLTVAGEAAERDASTFGAHSLRAGYITTAPNAARISRGSWISRGTATREGGRVHSPRERLQGSLGSEFL